MDSKINLGGRTFNTPKQAAPFFQDNKKQYFNFEISYNSLTGAGQSSTSINLLNPLTFPFPVGLKSVDVYGNYSDTANGLSRISQPYSQFYLYPQGGTSNINTVAPTFVIGSSSAISSGITVSGVLGSNISYNSEDSLYIPAQTPLIFEGFARYQSLTIGTDQLLLIARVLFIRY